MAGETGAENARWPGAPGAEWLPRICLRRPATLAARRNFFAAGSPQGPLSLGDILDTARVLRDDGNLRRLYPIARALGRSAEPCAGRTRAVSRMSPSDSGPCGDPAAKKFLRAA